MTAIKIKNDAKSADAQRAAATNSRETSVSTFDEAPASKFNDRDNNSHNADGSSDGSSLSANGEAIDNCDTKDSSANAGGGRDDASGGDANHDSNDDARMSRNGATETDADANNEEEMEENSPSNDDGVARAADASGSGNEGHGEENGNEYEEMWELKKVLTVEDITKAKPIMCNGNACPNVACSVYQSTLDTNGTNAWFSCVDCQEYDYGGWPEDPSEIPISFMTKQHRETIRQYCTRDPDNVVLPDLPTSCNGAEDHSDDEEAEDKWDLIEVIDLKELKKKKPKPCAEDGCSSAACSVWASKSNKWHGCIDCMEDYYGGWPSADEMPVKHLTEEHRALLAEKCSEREDPPMPDLPSMPLLATIGGNPAASITPLPSHEQSVADNQSNIVVGSFHSKGKKSSITPSPMPPKGSLKQSDKKPAATKIDPKLKEMHDKWQAEAEKLGAPPGTKIIVDKNAGKKLVFDSLHDLFSPVNITQLHQKLKGVVPGLILRKCLDEMVDKANDNPFADDSDDEDEKPSIKKNAAKKTSSDEYAGSLRMKEGRNANTTLYFVDHTKLQNNGNGLLPEIRNDLYSNLEKSKQELTLLGQKHKEICLKTTQLLSEPKNEELESELQMLVNKMEVVDNGLEDARAYASNAKYAKQLKGRIDKMAGEWRKRKRTFTEFIISMEDATDGAISMKKVTKGDGPIEIETDDGAIKVAKAYAGRKKAKVVSKGLKQRNGASAQNGGLVGDEKLIGVLLNSKGVPQRVYIDEE